MLDNDWALFGLVVIFSVYVSIGIFVVIGSSHLTGKMFTPQAEQRLYAAILIPVAAFYWACVAYFSDYEALTVESAMIILFIALAVVGFKKPWALIVAYPLHGVWDLLHELTMHAGIAVIDPTSLTEIPLAYGVFCATFDIGIALYFVKRRKAWLSSAD